MKKRKTRRFKKLSSSSFSSSSSPSSSHKKTRKRQLRDTYEQMGLYKDNRQHKQIDNEHIGVVLDAKIKHLLAMFKDESLMHKSPKTDFHEVTNITWMNKMKKSKEKNYFTQFDNYRVTQDKVYYNLIQHVKEFIVQETKKTKLGQSVNHLLQSWENLDSTSIEEHMRQCVTTIDEYRQNKSNVWHFLADMNQNELISHSLPLRWVFAEDKKNVQQYANYIISPTLGLYNIDIYFQTDRTTQREKQHYLRYISRLFDTCSSARCV